MNEYEKWLERAIKHIGDLVEANVKDGNKDEEARLRGKLEGLKLAKGNYSSYKELL